MLMISWTERSGKGRLCARAMDFISKSIFKNSWAKIGLRKNT